MRPTPPHVRQAGFTLLETLVALALLGIVMSTVFGVIGSGLRSAHRDEDRLLLGLVAQNLLERSRLDLSPLGGTRSGDIGGGLRWQIDSEPYELPKGILPPVRQPGGGDTSLLKGDQAGTDKTSDTGTFGQDNQLGSGDQGLSQGDTSGSRSSLGSSAGAEGSMGSRAGRGLGSSAGSGLSARDRPNEREKIKLRLVRVTVSKGDQSFQLTGVAMEPRRRRTTQPGLSSETSGSSDGSGSSSGQSGFSSGQSGFSSGSGSGFGRSGSDQR